MRLNRCTLAIASVLRRDKQVLGLRALLVAREINIFIKIAYLFLLNGWRHFFDMIYGATIGSTDICAVAMWASLRL